MRAATVDPVAERFRTFWADKSDPQSRGRGPEFLRTLAGELRLLFGDRKPNRVLEIGCGDGRLFDFLDFSPDSYRGVDFGPLMLAAFRGNHAELDLIEAEASSYNDGRIYDLIFAHDVISHFSLAMLDRFCRNARQMIHSESLIILASVPWRSLRNQYDLGVWRGCGQASFINCAKSKLRRLAGQELTGRWFAATEVRDIAARNGLHARFHGSITHPYRFHAVLDSPSVVD